MIRRPPRSTQSRSSAASDVYKRQHEHRLPTLSSNSKRRLDHHQPGGQGDTGQESEPEEPHHHCAAHGIPYVAQASPHNFRDLIAKAGTAFDTEGPAFINVLSPCPRGWRSKDQDSIALAKLMVDSCFWPLYEIVDGVYNLSYNPKKRKGNIRDWMKQQGRFKHLFKPENEHLIAELQENVDQEWENLKKLAGVE